MARSWLELEFDLKIFGSKLARLEGSLARKGSSSKIFGSLTSLFQMFEKLNVSGIARVLTVMSGFLRSILNAEFDKL